MTPCCLAASAQAFLARECAINGAITPVNAHWPLGAPGGVAIAPAKVALQRDVAVLSLGLLDPLRLERAKGADQLRAGLVRDDHVVDVSALRGRVGVREARLVVRDQLV